MTGTLRRRVITRKTADCKLQLVTDVTLHIAFEEPVLIKEMAAENIAKQEYIDLIDNMVTGKVSTQCYIFTHRHFWRFSSSF